MTFPWCIVKVKFTYYSLLSARLKNKTLVLFIPNSTLSSTSFLLFGIENFTLGRKVIGPPFWFESPLAIYINAYPTAVTLQASRSNPICRALQPKQGSSYSFSSPCRNGHLWQYPVLLQPCHHFTAS